MSVLRLRLTTCVCCALHLHAATALMLSKHDTGTKKEHSTDIQRLTKRDFAQLSLFPCCFCCCTSLPGVAGHGSLISIHSPATDSEATLTQRFSRLLGVHPCRQHTSCKLLETPIHHAQQCHQTLVHVAQTTPHGGINVQVLLHIVSLSQATVLEHSTLSKAPWS